MTGGNIFKMALAGLCVLFATAALGQTPSGAVLAKRAVERRAVEAAIWGMPAVNYDLMLQQMLTKTAGKPNQVLYWSRPLDWHNQTLTPNPDSIYFMVFYDTSDVGPVVIEVPPADTGSINGNIVNVWQTPLEDTGRSGADQGKGGKYLLLPPGYNGTVPDGYIALRPETYGGFALLRSNLASHDDADVAKSVAYGKRIRVYPLSQAASPPETVFTDAKDVLFDSTIPYDASFFKSLDRVVQKEPWLDRDRAMIDQLKTIGIQKGWTFKPDQPTTRALEAGIREAGAWLATRYDAGMPAFFPGGHWMLPASPDLLKATQGGFSDANEYPVDDRGMTYTYAYVGIKRLGAGQFYLIATKDKHGDGFDGGRTYRLTVPANAPVEQYWSATAYDRKTHALIRDMPRASRSSQIADIEKNADGSIDLYFGPKAPPGKEANWVPTAADGRFEVMFRLYAPTQALFDKSWVLPDIEPVKP